MAIGDLGEVGAPLAVNLVPSLRDPADEVRRAAAAALGRVRPDLATACERLRTLPRPSDAGGKRASAGPAQRPQADAASSIPRRHWNLLASMLSSADAEARCSAVAVLCNNEASAQKYYARIRALADDPVERVRLAVLTHLPKQVWNAEVRVLLWRAIRSPSVAVRGAAVQSLGRRAAAEDTALEMLLSRMHDENPEVQRRALVGLGQAGDRGRQAAAEFVVTAALADHSSIRSAALYAMRAWSLATPAAAEVARRALWRRDSSTLVSALRLFAAMRPVPAEALAAAPRIRRLAFSADWDVRHAALAALVVVDGRGASSVLVFLAKLRDPDARNRALAEAAMTRYLARPR